MSTAAGLAGQRAVVMGLGLFGGGAATTRFLAARGASVLVTDTRDRQTLATALAQLEGTPFQARLGEHRESDFTHADLVVVNPAVAPSNRFVCAAREAGATITSEFELMLESCPAPVALISGTQGKSSCANFLAQLLAQAGRQVWLGGNIGRSLLDDLDAIESRDFVVAEVSSYQLESLPLRPFSAVQCAALVNVLSDHLERHGDWAGYAAAKARLISLLPAGGTLVLPNELAETDPFRQALRADLVIRRLGGAQASTHWRDERFVLEGRNLAPVSDLKVLGDFQRDNLLTALSLARAMGSTHGHLTEGIVKLEGLPHRLEDLGLYKGVRVIDNGVCTTPDSALSALGSIPSGSVLLVGGQAKRGLPFDELAAACARHTAKVIAFGASAPDLARTFAAAGVQVQATRSLEGAVQAAYAEPIRGGVLLFSPACASFDAYANFRARAEAFRRMLPA